MASNDVFANCAEFTEVDRARQNPSMYKASDVVMGCFDPYTEHSFHISLERKDFLGPTNVYIPGYVLHVHVLTLSKVQGQAIADAFDFSVNQKRSGRLLGYPFELAVSLPK